MLVHDVGFSVPCILQDFSALFQFAATYFPINKELGATQYIFSIRIMQPINVLLLNIIRIK